MVRRRLREARRDLGFCVFPSRRLVYNATALAPATTRGCTATSQER